MQHVTPKIDEQVDQQQIVRTSLDLNVIILLPTITLVMQRHLTWL